MARGQTRTATLRGAGASGRSSICRRSLSTCAGGRRCGLGGGQRIDNMRGGLGWVPSSASKLQIEQLLCALSHRHLCHSCQLAVQRPVTLVWCTTETAGEGAYLRHHLVLAHVLHCPVLRAAKVGQQQHLRGGTESKEYAGQVKKRSALLRAGRAANAGTAGAPAEGQPTGVAGCPRGAQREGASGQQSKPARLAPPHLLPPRARPTSLAAAPATHLALGHAVGEEGG